MDGWNEIQKFININDYYLTWVQFKLRFDKLYRSARIYTHISEVTVCGLKPAIS